MSADRPAQRSAQYTVITPPSLSRRGTHADTGPVLRAGRTEGDWESHSSLCFLVPKPTLALLGGAGDNQDHHNGVCSRE